MTLAIAPVLVVALAEETIFRGYLLTRLRESTDSTVLAIILSSAVFALGHSRSLVASVTMHFCQDFVTVVVPWLAHHG